MPTQFAGVVEAVPPCININWDWRAVTWEIRALIWAWSSAIVAALEGRAQPNAAKNAKQAIESFNLLFFIVLDF
jgi:hypothetical protein